MSQAPDFTQTVSLRLSEVLADIGVNVRLVEKKRGAWLLIESIHTASIQLDDFETGSSRYYLGSRSEVTTTPGLQSDIDTVNCINQIEVIKDLSERELGKLSYLMIENESESPGYCLLEKPTSDDPSPVTVVDKFHYKDWLGRILLNKTMANAIPARVRAAAERSDERYNHQVFSHGPATVLAEPSLGKNHDIVIALKCKSWPLQARRWLDQKGQWPPDELRRDCGNTSCLVVAAGRKGSRYEELEWRISTSLAERCLMFSLNITQIQCYVLMKMLIKTYIKPYYEDAITSYMCKTVLFYSIAITHPNFWSKSNLIPCLLLGMLILYNCVLNENCPHFIIPGNNLMAGHIAHESKPDILEKLGSIISSVVTALLGIECDDLGTRLCLLGFVFPSKLSDNHIISAELLLATAQIIGIRINTCLATICDCSYKSIQKLHEYIFKVYNISNQGSALDQNACSIHTLRFCTTLQGSVLASGSIQNYSRISASSICNCSYKSIIQTLLKYILKLISISNQGSALDQKACSLLTPWFYTTLGSVLASRSIRKYNRISASALGCISMGLNTDVSSSKLKKASMFYCAGDIQETEIILEDTERKYDLNIVEPICNCYDIAKPVPPRRKFVEVSNNHNEKALQNIAAFCVRYLPSEIYCVPHELKYEMFRSTKYDLSFRGLANIWMDSAVADSLPYMYFLQYKTYNYLGKQDDKQRALSNLIRTINQEPNLGHRETALNLLGQCMEGEDRANDALNCYLKSLSLRGRNNAAIIHICRLIYKLVNDKARI